MSLSKAINNELEKCYELVENKLNSYFIAKNERYASLLESMRYSLLAGGKRIRAIICIKFCEAAGGKQEDALNAACAIEMLHAYTLIHDDLPCMDNSDIRRGKPSNHIKYGEFTATLAGDALQAAAFETLLGSNLPPATIVQMGRIFSDAAGAHGVCGGQYLDLSGEEKKLSKQELSEIHSLKTSALFSAAARIGVIAANGTPEQIKAAEKYTESIGLAFQIRDDLLDITSTTEELGKPVGSDSINAKTTFATLMGITECEKIIETETKKAIEAIKDKFDNPEFLIELAKMLAFREN